MVVWQVRHKGKVLVTLPTKEDAESVKRIVMEHWGYKLKVRGVGAPYFVWPEQCSKDLLAFLESISL